MEIQQANLAKIFLISTFRQETKEKGGGEGDDEAEADQREEK